MSRIRVPAQSDGKTFSNSWRRCVGSGHMGLALRSEYQEALGVVQSEIGFDYIRGHGLLSDSVGIYRTGFWTDKKRSVSGVSALNFTYVDMIYDAFIEKRIRPFVELGFMPEQLASGDKTCFWWKGNVTPPKDYAEWRRLIGGLVRHLVQRYGRKEVATWPFEIWNEPDLGSFWTGGQDEYFRLYRETVAAIKEVEPAIAVGGPATCPASIGWITPFLEMCDKEDVPVDFVSTHSYAGSGYDYVGEYSYQGLRDPRAVLGQFEEARRLTLDSPRPRLPLHITEYNTSYSPRCPLHDTALNAAYLARLLAEGGDYADSFSYWTFSDVFEENDIPRAPFHGGFGLLGLRCLRKPTFHLFSFFSRLGATLLYRDENLIVTRRSDDSLALVLWHPVTDRQSPESLTVRLDLPVAAEQAVVETRIVNEEYGNAWNCWRTLGRPRHPSERMMQTLHDASVPALKVERRGCAAGRLQLDLVAGRNEIRLVEIGGLADESGGYVGLDDRKIPGYLCDSDSESTELGTVVL